MTVEEKKQAVSNYCELHSIECERDGKVCELYPIKELLCPADLENAEDIEKAYKLIHDDTHDAEDNPTNPYWENICKLQDKQRKKGIETYGQGLEYNHQPILIRIQHIQEELIDALMYLEWLKESVNGQQDNGK